MVHVYQAHLGLLEAIRAHEPIGVHGVNCTLRKFTHRRIRSCRLKTFKRSPKKSI